MELKTDRELREILDAEIKEIGGLRKWAEAKEISPSLISHAVSRTKMVPFPPKIAKALRYKKVEDAPRWQHQARQN